MLDLTVYFSMTKYGGKFNFSYFGSLRCQLNIGMYKALVPYICRLHE